MVNRLEEQRAWSGLSPKVKRGVLALKENVTIENGRAVSPSGTDVSHIVELVVKTTPEQIRGLQAVDALSAHEIENGGFVFAFFQQSRTIVERFPSLTAQDVARLMFVGTYTAWETGRLQYDNGRIIKKKALEKLVGMSTRRFNELFKRFIDEDILTEREESGEIFINPTVFYKGSVKKIGYDVSHLDYTRMFKDTVRDLYKQFCGGRSLGQLALVYSVMPFLNFDTNLICYNQEETDSDLLKPMNLDKLSVLLGYESSQKLKVAMNRVWVNEKPVFNFVQNPHDRRKLRITVNPDVVFGGSGAALVAVKAQFIK